MKTMNISLLKWAPAAVLALLAISSMLPVSAQESEHEEQTISVPDAPVRKVVLQELVMGDATNFEAAKALYNQAIIATGDIKDTLDKLTVYSKDTAKGVEVRANALLLMAHLQWNHGQFSEGLEAVEQAANLDPNADTLLMKGYMLEAKGDTDGAIQCYEQSLKLTTDPKRKEKVRLRLTFAEVGKKNLKALADLAQTRDAAFRNRAAVALAILNSYEDAARLYSVHNDNGDLFRQHLRLSQWALRANDLKKAQDEAWKAAQLAKLDRDVRYALSVAVDAFEADKSLDKLLKLLNEKRELDEDEQNTRIEILKKLRRYDEAIKLFLAANRSELSDKAQAQLLRMYRDAGRSAEMIAEYKKLIVANPQETIWPEGLSQFLLEQNTPADAKQVWEDFIGRTGDCMILLAGAKAMGQQGFDPQAIAASEKCIKGDAESVIEGLRFRFTFFLRRGQVVDAEQTLERMLSVLPADSLARVDVADGYERLRKPEQSIKVLEALGKSRPNGLQTDDLMRLAWLYDSLDRSNDALAVWTSMWSDGKVTPARRRLVEDRLLLLAGETGKIGDIAVELEKKVFGGTATPEDSGLLSRIYVEAEDLPAALEVVKKQYGEGTVESLREQAKICRALDRFEAYGELTQQLLKLEPESAVSHLQALILNNLQLDADDKDEIFLGRVTQETYDREHAERVKQVREWVAQLRKVGGPAAGAEFEAGILEMAGVFDEAVASYRLELAAHPGRTDNYLLLANLLKKQSREAEAVATLQYQVEAADRDDGFIVAIDGILNVKSEDPQVLRWGQRRVLERLTQRDDKLYLYDLLSELAEGERNGDVYLSALENSLAYANSRRSHVLRELISATGEEDRNSMSARLTNTFKVVDPQKNLVYSRRLIALSEDLPPEVYVNMGKALIKVGDIDNAKDAFNMAIDRTGQTKLTEQSAELFKNGGFYEAAAQQYERAMIGDAGNIAVIGKLADMRDRLGLREEANKTYLTALMRLLNAQVTNRNEEQPAAKQPKVVRAGKPADEVNDDYTENYDQLLAGFMRTLPVDFIATSDSKQPQQLAEIERFFEQTLQTTVASMSQQSSSVLNAYPRLDMTAKFARAVGFRTGMIGFADRIDAALMQKFNKDAALARQLVQQRLDAGLGTSAANILAKAESLPANNATELKKLIEVAATAGVDRVTPSPAAVQEALEQKSFELAAELAAAAGDRSLAASVYRQWIQMALDAPVSTQMLWAGDLVTKVILHAGRRLDREQYAEFCRATFNMTKDNPERLGKLLYRVNGREIMGPQKRRPVGATLIADMEAVAGQQLVSEAGLLKALETLDTSDNSVNSLPLDLPFVMSRLSQTNQVAFFARYLESFTFEKLRWDVAFNGLGVIVSKPLSALSQSQLNGAIKKKVDQAMAQKGIDLGATLVTRQSETWPFYSFTKKIDKANVRMVEELDEYLAASYPEVFKPGIFKVNLLIDTGRVAEAMPLFVGCAIAKYPEYKHMKNPFVGSSIEYYLNGGNMGDYVRFFEPAIFPQNVDAAVTAAEAKERETGVTPAVLVLQILLRGYGSVTGMPTDTQFLEAKLKAKPDDELVMSALYLSYKQMGLADKELAMLERLIARAPRNVTYRRAIFEYWQAQQNPQKALAAVGGRLLEVQQQIQSEAGRMMKGGDRGLTPSIRKMLQQVAAVKNGGSEQEAAAAMRGLWQASSAKMSYQMDAPETEGMSDWLLFSLDTELKRIKEIDDDAAPETGIKPPLFDLIFKAIEPDSIPPAVDPKAPKVLDMLAQHAFSISEFESLLRASDTNNLDIDRLYRYMELLTTAYETSGRLPAEFERLTREIETHDVNRKMLSLWCVMLTKQPQATIKSKLALLDAKLLKGGDIGIYQRKLIAQVYAKAGDEARASDIYAGMALLALSTSGLEQRVRVADIYDEARERLSEAGVEALATRLLKIASPGASSDYVHPYAAFIATLLEKTPHSKVLQDELKAVFTGPHANVLINLKNIDRDEYITLGAALSRVGMYDQALRLLETAVSQKEQNGSRTSDNVSHYAHLLGNKRDIVSWRMSHGTPSSLMVLATVEPILPDVKDNSPNAQQWLARLATAVPTWADNKAIGPNMSLQVLAQVALHQHRLGFAEDARKTAMQVGTMLAQPDAQSAMSASIVAYAFEKMNTPLPMDNVQQLVENKRILSTRLKPLVEYVASYAGAEKALGLGAAAIEYSPQKPLLETLQTLQAQAGASDKAKHWDDLVKLCDIANGKIERGEDDQLGKTADIQLTGAEKFWEPEAMTGKLMDFTIATLDGQQIALKDLRGKVVLLYFWATGCGGCRKTIPKFKEIYAEYKDKGFEIIGISPGARLMREHMAKFREEYGMTWPEAEEGSDYFTKYEVRGFGFPILLDLEGRVVTRKAYPERLVYEIKRLLKLGE